MNKLTYILTSGKKPKIVYYLANYIRLITPKVLFRCRLKSTLRSLEHRIDKDYIINRVNYYNRLDGNQPLNSDWDTESVTLKQQPICRQKVYFLTPTNLPDGLPLG